VRIQQRAIYASDMATPCCGAPAIGTLSSEDAASVFCGGCLRDVSGGLVMEWHWLPLSATWRWEEREKPVDLAFASDERWQINEPTRERSPIREVLHYEIDLRRIVSAARSLIEAGRRVATLPPRSAALLASTRIRQLVTQFRRSLSRLRFEP
jgi:hypothetical protein